MPKSKLRTDPRLLGEWRSDRRRTLAEWKWAPRTSAKQRKLINGIFGHLKLRYTRQYLHSDYQGMKDRQPYEVVAIDEHSVAIVTGGSIYHIHFEDRGYWISLGRQREWFKRPRRSAGQQARIVPPE